MMRFFVLFLAMACGLFVSGMARANILITPTQVVFDERQRFANVTLANITNNTVAYEIEWQLFKMKEGSGAYQPVEILPEHDLSKLILFAPRRVTLSPKGKQRIKLRFNRPADIPDGDYHVHLKFKSVPVDVDANGDRVEKALVQVGIKISYTIPVVVRIGEPTGDVTIGQIEMDRDQETGQLQMSLPVRRGADSLYSVLGYIRVYHQDADGEEELVGEISNANIFPEITQRIFSVPITKDIRGGRLRVELKHFDRENDFVYAQKVFDLQ